MQIVGAKIAKICETRKGRERSFRNLGIGGCRCALPLTVVREFREVRKVREVRDWAYRTAQPLPKFPNFPKFPNKKKIATSLTALAMTSKTTYPSARPFCC